MRTISEILSNQMLAQTLQQRFLRYVKTWTTSNPERADAGCIPSTTQQMDFALQLKTELNNIGIIDAEVTQHGYVYACIPASTGFEHAPSIGFCAHLDTVSELSGKNVAPRIWKDYDGGKIILNENATLDPNVDTHLQTCIGDIIITSDGNTLLGADDKAGIAEIITAIEVLLKNQLAHGTIELLFSPDEETGHGMDKVPLERLKSKAFYTLDGGQAGEIEHECFNAHKAVIHFTGKSKHTGTARPDFVNAITMAANFISLLPQNESPEATDNYLGFYAPMEISGHIEQAQVTLFLRDFDHINMNYRIETVSILAKAIEQKNPGSSIKTDFFQQYLNMKEKISKNPPVIEKLMQAVRSIELEPQSKPIRGGTDGARLTELGIPCPNIFTGGHNFHSRNEWISISQMICATEVILSLIALWSKTE